MVGLDDDPSRAQIVLVGALAIAFIILGIVVVFNTSLYAENVDSTGTVSSVNQAEQVRHAGGQSVADLAYYVNEGNYSSETGGSNPVSGGLENRTENLSLVWQSLYAQAQPTVVNVSLDEANSEYGVRVFQPRRDNFRARDDADQANWTVTPVGTPPTYADVGRFDLTLERSSLDTTQDGAFHVAARGGDGSGDEAWRVVWFVVDSGDLDVYVASGSAPSAPAGWQHQTGTQVCNDVNVGADIEVDMENGSISGTPCTFEFTEELAFYPTAGSDGYELRFGNGGNATGQYQIYLSNTEFDTNSFGTRVGNAGEAPYYSYILWKTTAIVEYGSPSASYTRTATVPVYNSTR